MNVFRDMLRYRISHTIDKRSERNVDDWYNCMADVDVIVSQIQIKLDRIRCLSLGYESYGLTEKDAFQKIAKLTNEIDNIIERTEE